MESLLSFYKKYKNVYMRNLISNDIFLALSLLVTYTLLMFQYSYEMGRKFHILLWHLTGSKSPILFFNVFVHCFNKI